MTADRRKFSPAPSGKSDVFLAGKIGQRDLHDNAPEEVLVPK